MTNEELLQIIEKAARDKATTLDLSGKSLTTLPEEISQLFNLKELDLSYNRLARLPAVIGQLYNLSLFYLSYNQLTSLPAEIGQLSNLRELYLYFNQLTNLPKEIGQLSNLSGLYLSSNQLTNLPAVIGQLSNLRKLHLYSNQLTSLPVEIGQLSNLRELYLYSNQLTSLPVEIGQLFNLSGLYLSSNQLTNLPAVIGQLFNLRELYLYSNQLTSLPKEIGQLSNLSTLELSFNQLTSLPEEIGQLSNLSQLYLSNNQFTMLPVEIGQFSNLSQLDLSNNQLTMLPVVIGQFSNLSQLDLSNNQLTTLPAEIGQLSNLNVLYLDGNQLKTLPTEIGQLSNLSVLDLSDNPLKSLPPEIRINGFRAILNFYRQQLEQETDRLYEAKLLIVGEAGAGKTTLVKKIQNANYQLPQDENSTEGIDIIQWQFSLGNGKEFQINIWDFGGQEIYHATHQFFLTKRSLYVLVADNRKEDTDFYYWLNVVELLSDNSPLLIIKNEKQERKREINERELRGIFTNFKETLTTNFANNRGLPEIINNIKYYISNLPHIGTELPKTWVKVREALERDAREHISLEQYLNVCQEHGFTTEEDKLQLSGYLHDLGVCLHFQDDDLLRKTVILKPTWGTDAVYKVLDNSQVIENLGKFNRNDLANIWHENKYANMRAELLQLMKKFKLCYEIPSRLGTYIAPQLLSANQPNYTWDKSNNLILRYKYDFMPKGILTRFIVEMHSYIEQQTLVWKTGVVLSKDQTRAEAIENYNLREIKIRVAGKRKKELLAVISHKLEEIHNSYERLQYQILVPCNCERCKESQTPHSYPLNVLYDFLDAKQYHIQCQKGFRMVDVRRLIDDVLPTLKDLQLISEPVTRNQVFISYSRQDQTWFNKLQTHLKPMIRNQTLDVWDDNKIKPGAEWRKEIEKALAAAKVAVLMVSPDFLASDFIADNELPPLLDAAEAEGLTIIWIPISYSSYKETEIEKYQAAHSPNQPIDSLSSAEQNRVLVDICKKIKAVANNQ